MSTSQGTVVILRLGVLLERGDLPLRDGHPLVDIIARRAGGRRGRSLLGGGAWGQGAWPLRWGRLRQRGGWRLRVRTSEEGVERRIGEGFKRVTKLASR